MKQAQTISAEPLINSDEKCQLDHAIAKSFKRIAPFWPLKNLIAINPLQGLEELAIEEALKIGAAYFEQKELPKEMASVNRESIKWMQAYFDDGQADISMPLRHQGLYASWRQLALYDANLHNNDRQKQRFLNNLPQRAEEAIASSLLNLDISKDDRELFLTLALTTLPGWASYVKYRTEWPGLDLFHSHPVTQSDYLAVRLIILTLLWPEAKLLLDFHQNAHTGEGKHSRWLEKIQTAEKAYRFPLLKKLAAQQSHEPSLPEAQCVFCIDVRSEPFRKALESTGNYQTFGFTGFFGIPIQVINSVTNDSYASCPVLLSPKHQVKEFSDSNQIVDNPPKQDQLLHRWKRLYMFLQHSFTQSFELLKRTLQRSMEPCSPGNIACEFNTTALQKTDTSHQIEISLENISLEEQCLYARTALKMIGLTTHFAPIILLCGHGSTTRNNAYATSLNCGACGGRHGGINARVLAAILNKPEVRASLAHDGICIPPQNTLFIAAEHNTTTDDVILYDAEDTEKIKTLKANLEKARHANTVSRMQCMDRKVDASTAASEARYHAHDWAQVRPEWGAARNAAFIVAPRHLSSSLNLEGRCFLHSYDHQQDLDGASLTTILTSPMVVAHWINMQYLFSTIDNVAYGSGSKITQNITGKIGIMQGNASDLMTGLPLQAVYTSDTEPYHEPQRLMTVVFAPRDQVSKIVHDQPFLQKLLGNGWAQLAVINPSDHKIYLMNRDFSWEELNS